MRALDRAREDSRTLVYFDPRGMGDAGPVPEDLSAAAVRADFHALREHLGIDEAGAIGWSHGATNLIFLAKERPETIRSATFLHGNAPFGLTPHGFEGARKRTAGHGHEHRPGAVDLVVDEMAVELDRGSRLEEEEGWGMTWRTEGLAFSYSSRATLI